MTFQPYMVYTLSYCSMVVDFVYGGNINEGDYYYC